MRTASKPAAELRHIVDVDGQLIGIEPNHINAAILRALAGVKGDIVQVFGEHEMPIRDGQTILMREDQVLFFRSVRSAANYGWLQAA